MEDTVPEPFSDPIDVPGMFSTVSDLSPNPLGELDPSTAYPKPVRSFPWTAVLAGIGVLAALALIAAFIQLVVIPSFKPPDLTVRAYYQALQAQRIEGIRECFDPDSTLPDNILSSSGKIQTMAEEQARNLVGKDVQLSVAFQDLTYRTTENQGPLAKVSVSGKVRVYEATTGLGVTLPYNWDHELVKKRGRWYLRP